MLSDRAYSNFCSLASKHLEQCNQERASKKHIATYELIKRGL